MSAARKLRRALGGNYVPKVLKLARVAGLTPGTVTEARVAHDAWCPVFRGRPCRCDPQVKLVSVPPPETAR